MKANSEPRVIAQPENASEDSDCLVDLINRTENAKGGIDENPGLVAKLDRHILMDIQDDEIEFMCQRCPVLCTVKKVGGCALALVHNREECVDHN